ncbi:MAG: TVP38/TMEM64 family protein [Pseudomonadota bacterium]
MSTTAQSTNRLSFSRMAPLLLIVAAAVAGYFLIGDYLSFETLRDNREELIAWRDNNYLIAALTYMAIYILAVAFSLPGGLFMTLAGGFLFGLAMGTLMTVSAATIGATVLFLAAKTGLGDALYDRLKAKAGEGGMLTRIQNGLEQNEISVLFLMRLVPAVPFFVANLAPAFLGVGLRNYVLTTFFGIIPGTMVYTWIGSGLGDVFARGETPNLSIIFEWQVLGPILALCALAALPIVIKSLRGGRQAL